MTLAQAKDQLGYAQADTTSDTRLTFLIDAATKQWEDDTQTQTTANTCVEKLWIWPTVNYRLYWRPVTSVTSIEYYDTDGNQQTLDPSQYTVDLENRKIYPAVGVEWPAIQERWDAVTINYAIGGADVPEIVQQAILIQCDIMEELRGTTKEKDATIKLYENLVARYMRGSYP